MVVLIIKGWSLRHRVFKVLHASARVVRSLAMATSRGIATVAYGVAFLLAAHAFGLGEVVRYQFFDVKVIEHRSIWSDKVNDIVREPI